jgi:hypothetical protein
MIEQIDHLSYSSITTYQLCPRSWRFHYLERIPAPASGAMVFGNAVHGAAEEHIKCAFATDRMPLAERWAHNWQVQLDRNAENGITYAEYKGESEESLNELGQKMLSDPDTIALVDSLKPLVLDEQVQIERYVTLQVPGVPIPIVGYIDLIEVDGVPADFKTAGRSWNQDQAEKEMQPAFYIAALNQAGFYDPAQQEFPFVHYVFVKTKKPKVQIWESTRTTAQLFWLFGLIKETWEAISAGAFPPNTTTFKCSPRYCEYWGICRGAA